MTAFLYSFSHVLTKAIVQSMLSSVVIWLALLSILRILRGAASVIKYRLCIAALLACFIFFLLPFNELRIHNSVIQQFNAPVKAPLDLSISAIVADVTSRPRNTLLDALSKHSDLIFTFYALGVLWFSVRILLAYMQSQRLKKQVLPADNRWLQLLKRCTEKIGIGRHMIIAFSEKVDTPCVVGYAKATVLIPLSLATSLTPEQAEAVLLHELAHLKHFDYYINITVQGIRCLLFFNPLVWLIVRNSNLYRELACDELAAKHGDNISLAESLLQIAKNRNKTPAFAAALVTNKHSLSFRIQNLLNMNNPTTVTGKFSPGIVTAFFTVALILFTGSRSLSQNKTNLHERLAVIAQQMYNDGNRNFILIEALNDGILEERRSYNFTYIAGKILVNGKELPAMFREKYEARFKSFLLANNNNGGGFYSFRGEGLKMDEVLDENSSLRKKPSAAQSLARIDGRSFSGNVVQSMYKDGLIDTAKYFIEYKKDGVFVNHKKLEGAMGEKYWKMFADGEEYIPKTDKDATTIQNDPGMIPHIYIDAKGNQRMEYQPKTEAEKKADAERKAKKATDESKNDPPREDR